MNTSVKAILALFLSCLGAVYSQNSNNFQSKLSEYLSIQNKNIHFNGVVLVANSDNILFEEAIGKASYELNVPLTTQSKFKIASISKSFTGLLVATAIHEGKLNENDRIEAHLPSFKLSETWKDITVKQLVSHTSGIPHWKGYEDYWTKDSKLSLSKKQIITRILDMELLFAPGEKTSYSSPGYFLLASILENIYKMTYADIISQKISNKLNLAHTGIYNELKVIKNMAYGYHLLPDETMVPAPYRSNATLKGAGSLYSNSHDLLKWNMSLIDGKSWNSEILKWLFAKTSNIKVGSNGGPSYGMGWYLHESGLGRPKAYQSAGGTFGYSSISVVYPEEKVSIIVLGNISFLPVDALWRDIEKIVFGKSFELPEVIIQQEIPNKVSQNLVGTYQAANGMKLKVLDYQNNIYVKLGNKPPLKLIYDGDLVFRSQKINIEFEFQVDEGKNIIGLITEGRGEIHNFSKLME